VKRLPIWFLLLVSAGACTSQRVVSQPQTQVAPALTVERFLQAANARDLATMARLFGTRDGPIGDRERRQEVELRMDVIAEILTHNDYQIVSEGPVPGADYPSRRIGVDLTLTSGVLVRDVGFILVSESATRWLVNVIDVVKITQAG